MNEDIEQFKRELNSYNYHLKKMEELELQIEQINYRMSGSGCIPIRKIAPTVSPQYRSNIGLIERKGRLISDYDEHSKTVIYVQSMLKCLDNDSRVLLIEKFIDKTPALLLERKYNYTNRQLNRLCNYIIRNLLKMSSRTVKNVL